MRVTMQKISLYTRSVPQLVRSEGMPRRIEGYAIVWNSHYDLYDGMRETILPGACDRTLADAGRDVVFTANHNWDQVLGKRSKGQLELRVDEKGLWYSCPVIDGLDYAERLYSQIENGIVEGSSFTFDIPEGGVKYSRDGGQITRTISDLNLYEVCATPFPAYQETTTSARSRGASYPISLIDLAQARHRYLSGKHINGMQ